MTSTVPDLRHRRNGSSNANEPLTTAVAVTPTKSSATPGRKRQIRGTPSGAEIHIRIGTQTLSLGDADLQDADQVGRAEQQIEGTTRRIKFQFQNPLGLSDDARSAAFQLVATAGRRAVIRCRELGSAKFADVFQLYLAITPKPTDLVEAARYQRGLVEAACAASDPSNRDLALHGAHTRLKSLKLAMPIALMRKLAEELVGTNSQPTPQQLAERYLEFLTPSQLPDERRLHFLQGSFFEWDGKVWVGKDNATFEAKLTKFLQIKQRRGVTQKLLKDVMVNMKGLALLDLQKRQFPLWIESLDPLRVKPSTKLVFENGMVDEADVLQGDIDDPNWNPIFNVHDPRNFALTCLPYDFDPIAACPLWERTLGEIFPSMGADDRRIELLQEFMGWTLLSDPRGLEHFLVLVGDGSNGKSTILDIWTELLGPSNVSHVPLDELFNDFRVIELEGKLANIAWDMNHISKVAEGRLKQLVSREPVSANRKNMTPITLYSLAKLIFATNELPTFTDKTDGIWRRIIVMPFLQQFAPDAMDLRRKHDLKQELPGIFVWAMRGAQRLIRQGKFTVCGRCSAAVAQHRVRSNPITLFLGEECVLEPQHAIRKEDLYNHYKKWCEESNHRAVCRENFGSAVVRHGISTGRESTGIRKPTYIGVTLSARAALLKPIPDESIDDDVENRDACGADGARQLAQDSGPGVVGIEADGVACGIPETCRGEAKES